MHKLSAARYCGRSFCWLAYGPVLFGTDGIGTSEDINEDLGFNHFDRRSTDQQKNRLIKRLADLGYIVEIKPIAA